MGDPTKPDLRISYLEHRSMRADAARLTELLGTAQPADRLQVTRESLTGLATAAGGGRWEREREQAVKAALALKAIIDTHTGDEEAIAFPRYTAHFTAVEYAGLNKAALKLVGRRSFVFAGPWVLDHASPTERAELLGEQPMLLRILYRLALQPRYQRLVRPLRQPAEPAHS